VDKNIWGPTSDHQSVIAACSIDGVIPSLSPSMRGKE
jgi:hypothetical protein